MVCTERLHRAAAEVQAGVGNLGEAGDATGLVDGAEQEQALAADGRVRLERQVVEIRGQFAGRGSQGGFEQGCPTVEVDLALDLDVGVPTGIGFAGTGATSAAIYPAWAGVK